MTKQRALKSHWTPPYTYATPKKTPK